MKTTIALALALATTACGTLEAVDSALLSSHSNSKTAPTTRAVDVVINTQPLPEPTARPAIAIPSGYWVIDARTCSFDSRTCDDDSALRFDSTGPILCSPDGLQTPTEWADWTQVP
jgi:hypothetical protein